MSLKNVIVRFKEDKANRRWKVREAVSLKAVHSAYISAAVMGSIGSRNCRRDCDINGNLGSETVLADIIQVNSDNSERKPYIEAY